MAEKKTKTTKSTTKKTTNSKTSSKNTSTTSKKTSNKKNLVIVESPAKAKTIQKYLGSDFEVTTSMGHIADLPQKEIGVDVENGFQPSYDIMSGKKKLVNDLKKEAKGKEKVWLATDEDREGEAIAWNLINYLNLDKNSPRIVFHEITKEAIQEAIKNPRTVDDSLVEAQQGRRVLDRLVGFKISPVLWEKIKRGLSAGRVQSVAVKLVVERERERLAFEPEEYWYLKTQLKHKEGNFWITLDKLNNKKAKLKKQEDIEEVLKKLNLSIENFKETTDKKTGNKVLSLSKSLNFELKDSKKTNSKKRPAPPFTTSTLQQEASRKLGYGVKQTMTIAQKLYENGYITYMRTDSLNLSQNAIKQISAYVKSTYGDDYAKSRNYKSKSANAQEAHEAIRPTNISKTPQSIGLTGKEQKLYYLIWARSVASQMADADIEKVTYTFSPEKDETQKWTAKGETIIFPGFLKLYQESTDNENEEQSSSLPQIKKGESLSSSQLQATQNFTKPPARYTEASLVKKLESEGIGRPSTYAPTISTIIDRGYITTENKQLVPTEISFVVNDFLEKYFSSLMDYKFTANMEEKLDKIAEGEINWQKMMEDFYENFQKELEKAKQGGKEQLAVGRKCPECGGELVYKFSKAGKFIGCENYPDCKHTEQSEEEKNYVDQLKEKYEGQPCPEGGKIVVKVGKYGPFLASSEYPNVKRIKPIPDEKKEELEEKHGGGTCDKCGEGKMIVKKSRRGQYFLACNQYPNCKNAKKIPNK